MTGEGSAELRRPLVRFGRSLSSQRGPVIPVAVRIRREGEFAPTLATPAALRPLHERLEGEVTAQSVSQLRGIELGSVAAYGPVATAKRYPVLADAVSERSVVAGWGEALHPSEHTQRTGVDVRA